MAHLNRTTEQWQQIDTAHHMHTFTDYKELAKTAIATQERLSAWKVLLKVYVPQVIRL